MCIRDSAKTGANANAFTSFDRTCYLFTATEQLDESLDVLLGMVGLSLIHI